jgi:hypothetical protein
VGIAGRNSFATVFAALQETGFLLESDANLPSICSIVTGEPVRGSWWSHPLAHEIFSVNKQLDDHLDVLLTKLVSGKVTFVHRKFWSELIAIGSSHADWQLRALKKETVKLLGMVEAEGEIRTDLIEWLKRSTVKPGEAARQLEERLLVVSSQVHTDKGKHAKLLHTWEHWQGRIKYRPNKMPVRVAMNSLELLLRTVNEQFGGKATLPWTSRHVR